MFFSKKADQALQKAQDKTELKQDYWSIVKRQFFKNRLAVWSLRFLYLLIFIAIFADFIANEKPLYCKIKGESYYPVLKSYAVSLGMAKPDTIFLLKRWDQHEYESVIFPPIAYSPTTLDKDNARYVGPMKERKLGKYQGRHYLGTDQLGRDVAAGMVHGTRVAMMVGILSMSIATLLGILLGALAGYFGDDRLRASRVRIWLNLLGFMAFIFYGFIVRGYSLADGLNGGHAFREMGITLGLFILFMGLANLLTIPLKRIPFLGTKKVIAMDILVMRLIEIISSIPVLILILAVLAVLSKPSIYYVMVIIGAVSWPGIAKFVRAELLRIRRLEYIEAAQALGYSEARIIFRHAIPNSLAPVLITVAFGIASAILTESFLSFLGVGVPPEQVTWGSLLNLSRQKITAWWLAIFPGFAIFLTVTLLNLIGEGLTEALDPRSKQ
jgi:peptide/nickel transport system permease protein